MVVLVHGLFSSGRTWLPLHMQIAADPDIPEGVSVREFEYPSPRFRLNPSKRIPDFDTLAESLKTFLNTDCRTYPRIILVGHSQGGLIIQRYLARALAEGHGHSLARVRRVVLLACPNNGSQFMLSVRKSSPWWFHPQERQLRPSVDAIMDAHRRVMSGVVFASGVSAHECLIPFAVYAGESDNIVPRATATSVFPDFGVIPGDHTSMLKVRDSGDRVFATVKMNILLGLVEDFPDPSGGSLGASGSSSGDVTLSHGRPLMRITTTTTRESETETDAVEIFDADVAALWIESRRREEGEARND